MPELLIPKIEKEDLAAPVIEPDGTAIVLQRHEKYVRDRSSDVAGSITPESAEGTRQRDLEFFEDLVGQEDDGAEVMVLFASSDTQYAGKGRRSMETAQLAQDAATEVFKAHGIDPAARIINFNPDFSTGRFDATDQDVRPIKHLREPQMFDESPDYVRYLRGKYGDADGNKDADGFGLSQEGFAAHESDAEKTVREEMGAEGVYDTLDRTKHSVRVFERYAKAFHANNPNKRLVIWAATHYDTISPLVKDATDTSHEEFLPVDYGAGIVINIEPGSRETNFEARSQKVALNLGKHAIGSEPRQ